MLNIGDFARLGRVSVRMLRHYDDLGLLAPARVGERTGHRRYEIGQLSDLNRLVALKELGFSLREVGEVMRGGVGSAELRGMLRLRRAELEWQVRDDRHRLARVEARLRLVEGEQATAEPDVTTKGVEAMLHIAALSKQVTDATHGSTGSVVEDLFIRSGDLMDGAGFRGWSR